MAGRFGEADVARNGGLEELVVEERFEVLGDLLGEIGAVVVHGENDTFEGEAGVEGLADAVERAHEFGDAFEGEVFGLHGNEKSGSGDERVEGEKVERGGTVEKDEGVVSADGVDGVAELVLAAVEIDQLDGGADEIFAAGNELESIDLGGESRLCNGGVADEDVVDAVAGFVAGEAEATGAVGLRITVDQERLSPSRARAAARLMAVVVLPTPPFWLTTARTLVGVDGVAGVAVFASGLVGGWAVIIVVKEGYREVAVEAMAKGL